MSDFFIPLGGGNEVGASAYFLSVDGVNLLLDCGARLKGEELYPDYDRLLREMPDFSGIDLILISHGHYDHIGSCDEIASLAPRAEIFMTKDTKSLISMQLLELGRISKRAESERIKNERYRRAQGWMSRIQIEPVMKTFERKGCKITFLPAGHMMGAVMIYIESRSHRVLYSGDFSIHTKFGFNGMRIREDTLPGVLLLNAPNVYLEQEEWEKQSAEKTEAEADNYLWLKNFIEAKLRQKNKIYLYSRSIPRHLDLFYFLQNVFPDVPVILEPKSRRVAEVLAEMGYSVYGENIRSEEDLPQEPCIVVGQETGRSGCVPVSFDSYSLHASPGEVLNFVHTIGAKEIFLLHVYPKEKKKSLIDVLKKSNKKLSAVQAVNGRKYYLKRERTMTHEKILQEVMQKELETAREELVKIRNNRTKSSVEWAAIYGSLKYPEKHPRDAYQQIQSSLVGTYRISYDDYLNALKSANLDSEEKREYVSRLVEQGITWLKQSLDGEEAAIRKYAEFTEDLEPQDWRNRKTFFIGKCTVVFMILIDPDLKNDDYVPIVRSFGARYCDKLLRSIRDRLLKIYGMSRNKKTARDVLQKTEKALTESTEAAGKFDSDDEIEQLRFMNNNYKNSLELVQAMLDELNETIDEAAADAKNAAIASFYSTMNSEDYGNLLDSMDLVDRRLTALKEQKVKIPPQLLPLTIVFKQLIKFVKDCGIHSIDTAGREFCAEVEELAEYTYIGEAYTAAGEKKTVVVERPGWKFEDTVISLPTVREKEEGSL